MKILILGSGGREHALAWKIKQSSLCSQLFIAPGNPGTATCGDNVSIEVNDFDAIKSFCLHEKIEMVVVGPEDPLVNGIYDFFQQTELQSIHLIGPSQIGAQLEGSKAFAKAFMGKMNIPTASYKAFYAQGGDHENYEAGLAYLSQHSLPVVLKADGLAAGKGVVIAQSTEEALQSFKEMMLDHKFGAAGHKVVVEQFLSGIECSVFVLTDGEHYCLLPNAKDYKRIGEGDQGLNTGGMGAVSPVPFADSTFMQKVTDRIIEPTVSGLKQQQIDYKGFIFIGLIKVNDEPYVIEYNCRMGDPETEVVMPLIESDLVELLLALKEKQLHQYTCKISSLHAATVMLVSKGYPEQYEKNKFISGSDSIQNSLVFHAGTKMADGELLTNGGRVMTITTVAESLAQALQTSKDNANLIQYEGKYFRKDIGYEFS